MKYRKYDNKQIQDGLAVNDKNGCQELELITDEFYQNKICWNMSQQIINKMSKQQQFPDILIQLNNLRFPILLSILSYLDKQTKQCIKQNSTFVTMGANHNRQNDNQIFLNLVALSLFMQKYLKSTDRSVYLSFYSQPAFLKYQADLFGEICVQDARKYFVIQSALQQLFMLVQQQLKCMDSRLSFIQLLQTNITDPEIPMPRMRKEGIAMHCNSSLQFGLADLKRVDGDIQQDQYIEDCVLDLEQYFLQIQEEADRILVQIILEPQTGFTKPFAMMVHQLYHHPQMLTLQNYKSYLLSSSKYSSLAAYNLFIYLHALLSGVAQLYHEYIVDQGKDFQRFVQFLLRFGIFRGIILSFENSFISRLLYNQMWRIMTKTQEIMGGHQIGSRQQNKYKNISINQTSQQKQQNLIKMEQIIIEDLQLQNKKSNQPQIEQIPISIQKQSKQQLKQLAMNSYMPVIQSFLSSPPIFLPKSVEITSRLYLIGPKIWSNQSRRKQNSQFHFKQIQMHFRQKNMQDVNIMSPSKHSSNVSQESINSRCFIRILNNMMQEYLLDKIANQIQQQHQNGSQAMDKRLNSSPVRDQDIVNIFGKNHNNQIYEATSPTLSHGNEAFTYSYGSISPESPGYSNLNDFLGRYSSNSNSGNSSYVSALINIQNKIKMQPYRNQKVPHNQTETSSISPEKPQLPTMFQTYPPHSFQSTPEPPLSKIPSLSSKRPKLNSKLSLISIFTKLSEAKPISNVEELIQNQTHLQQQLLMEYYAYLIDLSINQANVHWCGFTQHALMGDYYAIFQENLVRYCQGFMAYLGGIVQEIARTIQNQDKKMCQLVHMKNGQNLYCKLYKTLLTWNLQYLDKGLIHKKTIKKLLLMANSLLLKMLNKHPSLSLSSSLQNSDQLEFEPIKLQLDETDKMIQHYNEQMWRIQRNVSEQKLKIYQLRKSHRNIVQIGKAQYQHRESQGLSREKDKEKEKQKEKGSEMDKKSVRSERKRRNSQQVQSLHNIQ